MQRAADPESLPPTTNFSVEDAPRHVAAPQRPPRLPGGGGKKHPIRRAIIIVVILALAVAGYFRIQATRKAAAEKAAGPQRGGFAVPVVAGVAQTKDVPIYLDGLGTIQALNTVTVRARVDGQLEKLAVKEGDEVKAGDLLAQLDPAPFQAALDQTMAKQRTDEAQLANARTDLERYSELVQRKVIAQQQYDTQKALVAQFDATVKNDQAAVTSAKVQLEYTRIVSPISGRTGIRIVDVGNIVHANDQTGIAIVTQLRPISLIFTLPEQSLPEIHQRQVAGETLEVLAVSRDNKTTLGTGKLTVIDNQIDTTTGTIRLKAEFPNDENTLWPGQFVNARLLLTTRKAGVVVPASAVQRGPDGSYVYVIGEDSTVQMWPVTVAQTENNEALIDAGLKGGEKVVVDGQYKLQPGATVKVGDTPGHPGGAQPGGHVGPHPGGGQGRPGGGRPPASGGK
jgi:multidrug efflux system membrane fusion protein